MFGMSLAAGAGLPANHVGPGGHARAVAPAHAALCSALVQVRRK
jgi:hypothetical protein